MIAGDVQRLFGRDEADCLNDLLYDSWNTKKKELKNIKSGLNTPEVGEFRWYYDGVNIGREISKPDSNYLRAGLVIVTRTSNGLMLVIPLTTKKPYKESIYTPILENRAEYVQHESWLLINNARFLDKRRFLKTIKIPTITFPGEEVKKIKRLFGKLLNIV